MIKRIASVIYIIMCTVTMAVAQVSVEQSLDSIQILIGEQAHMTVDVTMKKGQNLEMPNFETGHYLVPGVEITGVNSADTTDKDDSMVHVRKVYTLTSFDENLYYLPPMEVTIDKKTYKGKSLALKVLTVPVDTLHPNKFFPPKGVQDSPFTWSEWSALFYFSIILIFLALIGVYLLLRLKDNKPIIAHVRIVKKMLPHQKAMKKIEKIKSDNLSVSGDQKEYYTQLTDTLRNYIEERYGFSAMEMTSSEIIDMLQKNSDKEMIEELTTLFTTADLVKFAKHHVQINENDMNLVNAVEFINKTKNENAETKQVIKPKITEDDKRSMKSRKVIKVSVIAIAVVEIALLSYVIYNIYELLS